jgi:hypothetical protein
LRRAAPICASQEVVDDSLINDRFDTDDGAQYQRVDPSEFDCFDEVDSTTVEDRRTLHRSYYSVQL